MATAEEDGEKGGVPVCNLYLTDLEFTPQLPSSACVSIVFIDSNGTESGSGLYWLFEASSKQASKQEVTSDAWAASHNQPPPHYEERHHGTYVHTIIIQWVPCVARCTLYLWIALSVSIHG